MILRHYSGWTLCRKPPADAAGGQTKGAIKSIPCVKPSTVRLVPPTGCELAVRNVSLASVGLVRVSVDGCVLRAAWVRNTMLSEDMEPRTGLVSGSAAQCPNPMLADLTSIMWFLKKLKPTKKLGAS